jgi:parallel beta helix pectate lyase-like protein/glycosyl hydrolase family 141/pectate lyase-like protein
MKGLSFLAACLLCICISPAASGVEFFVSPEGSDTNPGTSERPFATLSQAQEALRQLVSGGLDADVTVWIGKGTYTLDKPLVFGQETSGTEDFSVTFVARPGETVVLSGGRKISGWKPGADEVWSAQVPEAKGDSWPLRNLFVGGQHAVRARTPNQDAEPNCVQLKAAELSEDRGRFTLTLPADLLGDWKNARDVEVMVAGNWAINRKRVQSIDPASGTLVLAPPHRHGPKYIFPAAGRWCYLANARELLDQPGEWYRDRQTGRVAYRPIAGQDLRTAEVVAPVATQLILVRGTPQRPVRNLHFKGLRLRHTDWQLPPDGYMGIQACHYGNSNQPGQRWQRIPAAVSMADAHGCSIEGCDVAHLGGSGIELADGCRDCLIRGNQISDCSANGIMVAGPNVDGRVPSGCRVENNHIHSSGREFYGSIGIWVGFARGTVVSHNLVHGLPYTGISVGWQWNPEPTTCKENVIEFNHVFDVMNRLCDGGCIYTLGFQPGTIIRGNHLHGVHRSPMAQGAPNDGMFIDQGSKGYLFEENVIYDTASEPIRFNACQRDWHTWRGNQIGPEADVKESGKEIIEKAGLESR